MKAFYNTMVGRVVRRILQERIRSFWPDVHGLRLLGCGYATPYLRIFMDEAERVIASMPAGQGVHHWPYRLNVNEKNLVCLTEETELPIETNSVDRVLMIHALEHSELLAESLREIWRVLKSNGRVIVVVPNRSGLWARTDWSPFGQGTPYSAYQIQNFLRDNGFVHEQTEEALFMPPVKSSWFLKSAGFYERLGRTVLPVVAGVHIVEASKQLYARADSDSGSKVIVRGRGMIPKPIPQGF